jgi:thiol-disulfide isomerase/thioredoxin
MAIPWEKSFAEALRRARAAQKPVMVDFWANWCHWCHELDATTYRDPKVVELARDFVAVKVDTEGSLGDADLATRYGVEILPTIGFLSPAGRLFLRRTSFEGPERFPATLEEARRLATDVIRLEATLARDGKDAGALAGLGALLLDQQILDEGRSLLDRARRLDAPRPGAERKRTRRLLALAERQGGKGRPQAERLLEEALAIQPPVPDEDAAAFVALGEYYADAGNTARAVEAWKHTVQVAPGSPAAQRASEALERLPPAASP